MKALIRRVDKEAFFVLLPLALFSAFIEPEKAPAGVLTGGLLALLNFRGLSRSLENLLLRHRPAMKLLFLSSLRLFVLSAVIVVLAVLNLVNLVALAAGFTVVVVLVVIDGYRSARKGNERREE